MKRFQTYKEIILWCKRVERRNEMGEKNILNEGPDQQAATTAVIHMQSLRRDVFFRADSSVMMGHRRVIMYFKHSLYIHKHDHK